MGSRKKTSKALQGPLSWGQFPEEVAKMPANDLSSLISTCMLLLSYGLKEVPDVRKLQEVAMKHLKTKKPTSKGSKDVASPPAPPGMVSTAKVTEEMKKRQWDDPKKWTMTFAQWDKVLEHCISTEAYKTLKSTKKHVTMYDLNDFFVKPWTKKTGCGLATLMNEKEPPDATLMLSHAWAEDVEECKAAMNHWFDNTLQKNHPDASKDNVWVWFCVFANFQCEDGSGPSIKQQLDKDPFEVVITSDGVKGHGMCAIHTRQADLYTRLWCVLEIAAAKYEHLTVTSAMSTEYVENAVRRMRLIFDQGFDHEVCLKAAGVICDTVKAQCGCASDEAMLIKKIIAQHKEFSRLDEVVREFRVATLPDDVKRMARISQFRSKNPQVFRASAAELARTPLADWTEELLDAFYARVEDEDGAFRQVALQELKKLFSQGDSRAIEVAMQHATDEDDKALAAALEALLALAEKGDQEVLAVALKCKEKSLCKKGHLLQPDPIKGPCDLCGGELTSKLTMGCRACNYDECRNCNLQLRAPSVHRAAMQLLGAVAQHGHEEAVVSALHHLEHEHSDVRKAALEALVALAQKGDAKIVGCVCTLLGKEQDRSVCVIAFHSLERLVERGDKSATSAAVPYLEHEARDIRESALRFLKARAVKGDADLVAKLSRLVGEEQDPSVGEEQDPSVEEEQYSGWGQEQDPRVCQTVLQLLPSLAEQGDEAAISAAMTSLRHQSEMVRMAALEAARKALEALAQRDKV